MALMMYTLNTVILLLYTVMVSQALEEACSDPLGMENGNIKNSQITVSSVFRLSNSGKSARLNKNLPNWGAWCPNVTNPDKGDFEHYDEYIQIDLLGLTTITKVAIQGRERQGGTEFTRTYQISYSYDKRNWMYYREKSSEVKIFAGNTDNTRVVKSKIDLPILARYVRIHPGYTDGTPVCLRLELYGCLNEGILSYSIPQGHTTKNGNIHYKDTIYNGVAKNGILYNGTGLLTDGEIGPDNSKKDMGNGWVGWLNLGYVNITFEFYALKKFSDVTITINIDYTRINFLFKKSKILFGVREDDLSQSSALQYCPRQVNGTKKSINFTLPLCGNVGKFVRMQLYTGKKWLLISEIKFNSDEAHNTEKTFQTCGDSEDRCFLNTPVPSSAPTSTSTKCTDCNSEGSKSVRVGSDNLQITILIICVVLVVVILLLVVIFFLYRRRMLCFGTLKRGRSKDDHTTVHVELHETDEIVADSGYDKVNEQIGNPLYSSVDKGNEKQPMLSPVRKKAGPVDEVKMPDNRNSDLYAKPDFTNSPKGPEEYAEPVDCLTKKDDDDDDTMANPIYEGMYSEPLYGVTGTILVGPQEETLKRGYTMDKFPKDHLVFKEKIGDGQFGEVHIAEADIKDLHTTLGDNYKGKTKITVAVKTLKTDVSKDVKTDFFKEVRVMSRLQHENVVRLLGVCREDPVCMIVEYMENGDLNQYLRCHVLEGDAEENVYANTKQSIKYKDLMYIAYQVAAGMKYFASLNFVHRDLAARNCLVGEGLTVKLADFGMSRLLYSKHYYRVHGRVMLPIRWMAPESIFQGRFTTQTDVWSFGITLWEIFTLSEDFPYVNLTDEQVIDNAKVAFTKSSSKIYYNKKPDVCPQDVYNMMLQCWTSDPENRPNFDTLFNFLEEKVGPVGTAEV